MTKTNIAWLQGLVAAVISGLSDFALGAAIIPGHAKEIFILATISGMKAGAAYLKQSPLPGIKEE